MENDNMLTRFGKHMAELRRARGLSQEEFSFVVGLSRSHVGMIERGEKNITLTTLDKIAKGLGMPLKELFDYE